MRRSDRARSAHGLVDDGRGGQGGSGKCYQSEEKKRKGSQEMIHRSHLTQE
jgi:hypothetical protein